MKKLLLVFAMLVMSSILVSQVMFIEEYFDSGLPSTWEIENMFISIGMGVDNTNSLTASNHFGELEATAITPTFGPVAPGTVLEFEYCVVEFWFGGAINMAQTVVNILANNEIIHVINAATHIPQRDFRKMSFNLDAFIGQMVSITIDVSIGHRIDEIAIDMDNFLVYHYVDYDMKAISFTGSSTPGVGVQANYDMRVNNTGTQSASGYTVELILVSGTNETTVASLNGTSLLPGEFHDYTLRWTPTTAGNHVIYGNINWNMDTNPENNKSSTINIAVQPMGTYIAYQGNPNSNLYYSNQPLNYVYGSSVSQTLYYAEDINVSGSITHLTYQFRSVLNILPQDIPISFYIAHTDKQEFTSNSDWVPFADFTLVHQGTLKTSSIGIQEIEIELDTPFVLDGRNIVIMGHRHLTDWYGGHSWLSTDPGTFNRHLGVRSDTIAYNLSNLPNAFDIDTYFPNVKLHINANNTGILEGMVTSDGTPLDNTKIQILGIEQNVYSDATGFYNLPFILPGNIGIIASRYMFNDIEIPNISIISNQTTTQNIVMIPTQHDLAALSITGNVMVDIGEEAIFVLHIRNEGHQTASNYTVKLMQVNQNGNDIELASFNGVSIPSNTIHDFEMTWAPDILGRIQLYGEIIYALDEKPINNKSNIMNSEVVPVGFISTYIGDPDSTEFLHFFPYSFWFESTMSQSIYLEEEIGAGGNLARVGYTFNGTGGIESDILVKLYAAVTEKSEFTLTDTWVDFEDFTLVFEGFIPVSEAGRREIIIDLDTTFNYGGGNLVLMSYKPYYNAWHPASNNWQQTVMPNSRTIWDFNEFGNVDIENPEPALLRYELPNVTLYFLTQGMASLSGHVTHNGNPLADVLIEVEGTLRRTYTDEEGFYQFNYIEDDFLTIIATKHGYITRIFDNIPIPEATHVVRDFQMETRPVVDVLGTIISSDNGLPLMDAKVSMFGYDNYIDILTNNNGSFIIRDVYANFSYDLTVTFEGYQKYFDTIVVANTDLLIPEIMLVERAYIPTNFVATKNGNNIDLSWNVPSKGSEAWFTHAHTLEIDNAMGGYMGQAAVLIPAMRFSQNQLQTLGVSGAELSAVDFVPFTSNATYTIQIYTGGSGTPLHPGTLIYEQEVPASEIVPEHWVQVELIKPINIPTYGELWIAYKADILGGFACTAGPGPSVAGYGDVVWNRGNWEIMSEHGIDWNWLIRGFANGVYVVPNSVTSISDRRRTDGVPPSIVPSISDRHTSDPIPFTSRVTTRNNPAKNTTPLITHEYFANPTSTNGVPPFKKTLNGETPFVQSFNRALLGYDIWRTEVSNTENESAWVPIISNHQSTSYTDTTWGNVSDGDYRYVIKANYTENNHSLPVFSNRVDKNMTSVVTINITAQGDSSVIGANLSLINNDDPEYIYRVFVDNNTIILPSVWLGNYLLMVSLEGYAPYRDIDLQIDALELTIDVTLFTKTIHMVEDFEDALMPPSGWQIVDADEDGYNWKIAQSPGFSANNGSYSAMSESYSNFEYKGLTPDNWLITSPIDLPENKIITLWFFVATQDKDYPTETYSVLISSTSSNISAFNEIYNETLSVLNVEWSERYIDLTGYAGSTIYLAFRHHSSVDNFVIKIDDIEVYSSDKALNNTDVSVLPSVTTLSANYPNPFNPSTTISFATTKESNVRIDIYNVRGQRVKVLVNDIYTAGYHNVEWNGKDENDRDVASGVYFYRMQSNDFNQTRRMVLMK